MKKDSLYTLIASDIVDFGKRNCNDFSYSLNLNLYLKQYNKQVQGYVRKNINNIVDELKLNSDILNVYYNPKNRSLSFCFYPETILSNFELKIYNFIYGKIKVNYNDIKVLSNKLLQDDVINNEINKMIMEVFNED